MLLSNDTNITALFAKAQEGVTSQNMSKSKHNKKVESKCTHCGRKRHIKDA